MPDIIKFMVIVGDSGCGKTCLLISFSKDKFPEEYVPKSFDQHGYFPDVKIGGKKMKQRIRA